MLDKSNSAWDKYMENYDVLDKWLEEQESIKNFSDVIINFFRCS